MAKYVQRLHEALVLAELAERAFLDVEVWRYPADPGVSREELIELSQILPELYLEFDAIEMGWRQSASSEVGGRLNVPRYRWFKVPDQSLIDQCDVDEEMDPDLRFFRLIDVPTMNAMCGFFDCPGQQGIRSVHIYRQGAQFARNLDLSIDGYFEMALAAGVTHGWQQAILDIKSQRDMQTFGLFESSVRLIYPEFSIQDFARRYDSLRVSLNESHLAGPG